MLITHEVLDQFEKLTQEKQKRRAKQEQVAEDESTIYEGEMPKFEVSEAVTVSTGFEPNPLFEGVASAQSDLPFGIQPKAAGPVLYDMYGIPINKS
jgi:hypothetical protein